MASRRALEVGEISGKPWVAKVWGTWSKVHHFKWHDGMKQNLYHRTQRDNGDCVLGENEDSCHPTFQFWKEVARQYAAISSGTFNLTRLGCKEGVDTFWNW